MLFNYVFAAIIPKVASLSPQYMNDLLVSQVQLVVLLTGVQIHYKARLD